MNTPEKDYYYLEELDARGVSLADIKYWLAKGHIEVSVWLDGVSLEFAHKEIVDGKYVKTAEVIDDFYGLQQLHKRDVHDILRHGCKRLRQFCAYNGYHSIALEAEHESIELSDRDLVIPKDQLGKISSKKSNHPLGFVVENNGRYVRKENREWHFSDMQAALIRALYDASLTESPWLNGKQTLHLIGAQTFRVKDLFKHQSNWRDLVESNGKGYYRLLTD